MTLHTPIALLLVAPWAALAWWLLSRRHESTTVPFVELWRGDTAPAARARRKLRRPPIAYALLLVALLAAIVGAARPATRSESSSAEATKNAAAQPAVEIVHIGARATPSPSILVRVKNDSSHSTTAILTIQSDQHPIDLPARGATRNYIFDLPANVDVVSVRLDDGQPWTARRRLAPKVEAIGAIPPELLRMVDVYSKSRPSAGAAPAIVIANTIRDLGDRPGAIAARGSRKLEGSISSQVVAHPITKNVDDWSAVLRDASISDVPRDGNWSPLLSVDNHTILAAREAPVRQVWVGFDSPTFARHPSFVVFWTDVLDWLAGGATDSDVFIIDRPETMAPTTRPSPHTGATSYASLALIGSLALLIPAMMFWPRPGPRIS